MTVLALRFHGRGDLRLEEVPEPAVGPNEVKIRVDWCGICGSDVHEYREGPRTIPVAGQPHPLTGETLPIVLGHELAGRIVQIGAGITGVDIGTPVVVEPLLHDRSCPQCRRGETNLCPLSGFHGLSGGGGGFAEYTVVPGYTVHPLPEGVHTGLGALVEPLAIGWHAVARSGIRPGGTALVLGADPIGLAAVAALRACGVRWVAVGDDATPRAELAVRLGADLVLDPRVHDLATEAVRATSAKGVDAALVCTKTGGALDTGLRAVRPHGVVCVVDPPGREAVEFDPAPLMAGESWVTGSHGYAGTDFPAVLSALADGRLDAAPLVTDQIALSEVVESGFDALLRPEDGHVKVLVRP